MIYEGNHDYPEVIDCSDVIRMGGRVKAGTIDERELLMDYYHYGKGTSALTDEQKSKAKGDVEIRVSIRSSKFPSVELFTLRNIKPADYRLVLVAIPRGQSKSVNR
jgi:hypothetical protein